MQTVNEKVPMTRVTKVSEMHQLDVAPDNAYLMIVHNGAGYKTTVGKFKEIIINNLQNDLKDFSTIQKISKLENQHENQLSEVSCILDSHQKTINQAQTSCNIISTQLQELLQLFENFKKDKLEEKDNIIKSIDNNSTEINSLSTDFIRKINILSNCQDETAKQIKDNIKQLNNTFNNAFHDQQHQLSSAISTTHSSLLNKITLNNNNYEQQAQNLKQLSNEVVQKLKTTKNNIATLSLDNKNNLINNEKLISTISTLEQQLDNANKQIYALSTNVLSLYKQMNKMITQPK